MYWLALVLAVLAVSLVISKRWIGSERYHSFVDMFDNVASLVVVLCLAWVLLGILL